MIQRLFLFVIVIIVNTSLLQGQVVSDNVISIHFEKGFKNDSVTLMSNNDTVWARMLNTQWSSGHAESVNLTLNKDAQYMAIYLNGKKKRQFRVDKYSHYRINHTMFGMCVRGTTIKPEYW